MKRRLPKAPRDARTFDDVCDMPRDNVSSGAFWFLVDEVSVSVAEQKAGEAARAIVTLPRDVFNRFVNFYNTGKMTVRESRK